MGLSRRSFLQLLGLAPAMGAVSKVASPQPKTEATIDFNHRDQMVEVRSGSGVLIAIAAEAIHNGSFVLRIPSRDGPVVVPAKDSLARVIGIARNSAPKGGIVEVQVHGEYP